jgi:hypothetical protein
MNPTRTNAVIAGSLFLIAMVTSLLGGSILESAINTSDYLLNFSTNTPRVYTGITLELINGIAVIGIAVSLFPVLRQQKESIAAGYVSFRIVESVFCIVSAIIPLLLINLSREYVNAEIADKSVFQALASFIISARLHITGLLIPVFFSLGALLFYYLLYKSKLIPRYIAVWGFTGAVLILLLNLLKTGTLLNMILVLPIILNEIFLGIWLIVKGFNPAIAGNLSNVEY